MHLQASKLAGVRESEAPSSCYGLPSVAGARVRGAPRFLTIKILYFDPPKSANTRRPTLAAVLAGPGCQHTPTLAACSLIMRADCHTLLG